MAKKRHRIGPHSRNKELLALDNRTREGRFATAIESDLIEYVGGRLNAVQKVLIELARIKLLKVALFF